MENATNDYDVRYLAGILFFNEGEYFEAHEVWESLWLDTAAPERKFYQGLIQAAVALYHFGNGNLRGAMKLFHSGQNYMKAFPSPYLGLDTDAFWKQMERCFAEVLNQAEPDRSLRPREEELPVLTLDPPPESWPDLADFETEDD